MRCSKSCYLCDLELVDLFDNEVIEQVYYNKKKGCFLVGGNLFRHSLMLSATATSRFVSAG